MKPKPKQTRTQSFHAALRTWDNARNAFQSDYATRGKAVLDTKRLKLMLAQKQAFHNLNEQFHKYIGA